MHWKQMDFQNLRIAELLYVEEGFLVRTKRLELNISQYTSESIVVLNFNITPYLLFLRL